MNELLTRLWRLGKPLQWRFLWRGAAVGIPDRVREATLIGGLGNLALDPREVIEARLFSLDDLPPGMPDAHRELAEGTRT